MGIEDMYYDFVENARDDDREKNDKNQSNKKSNKKEIIHTSKLVTDQQIVEQIYDEDENRVRFAVYNDGDVKYTDSLENDDEIINPIFNDALTEGCVLLPSEATEYGTTKDLLQEIKDYIYDYCDLTPEFESISAWYVLLTWVYDNLRTIPYLRVRGDTGTGKSRFEEVVGSITYHTIKAAGSVTPAPIYRMIKKWRGTVIIDEGDFRDTDYTNEVVKILNCGFQSKTPVIRCSVNDPDDIQILPTFSPKIIATRSEFKDKALESRCITEIMRETSRNDIPIDLPTEFYPRALELRNKCLMYRFRKLRKIDPNKGIKLKMDNIKPRIRQAMVSFPALFYEDEHMIDEFKSWVRSHQKSLVEENADSYEGAIINALAHLIIEQYEGQINQQKLGKKKITLRDVNIDASMISKKIQELRSFEASASGIGKNLKSMGINSHQKKVDGENMRRYQLEGVKNLSKLMRSYIANDQLLNDILMILKSNKKVTGNTKKVTDKTKKVTGEVTGGTDVTLPMGDKGNSLDLHNYYTSIEICSPKNSTCYHPLISPHESVTCVTPVTEGENSDDLEVEKVTEVTEVTDNNSYINPSDFPDISEKTDQQVVYKVLQLLPKNEKGLIDEQTIIDECEKLGISEEKTMQSLRNLYQIGDIFPPISGYWGVLE